MEWVLSSPQFHNTFGNLGFANEEGYHINENCNATLESILENILAEDKYSRRYRRNISFGQNVEKDLIPLLINTTDDKTVELLMKILVNLTIPVECLLSVETIANTDTGRLTIFEINKLLSNTKVALSDHRVIKVIIEFLRKSSESEKNPNKLTEEECTNINNTLLFLRNILHIPEDVNCQSLTGSPHTVQNQLLWNLFSESIDKVLIKLMTMPDAINWGVTMVQLIALIYKDQHVNTLHKLLNHWLESAISDSSEDNESNTSPPDRGSNDSSPMLTSDPTSDSSDTGASAKFNAEQTNSVNNSWDNSGDNSENGNQAFQSQNKTDKTSEDSCEASESNTFGDNSNSSHEVKKKGEGQNNKEDITETKVTVSENSDCGYGTQKENQGAISTSSNDDEVHSQKPVHQKPHTSKPRVTNKGRACINLQERKRKKLVKRVKANIINTQGLTQSTPTDEDISNVLKEFTVDFLLKGYNSLVETLHKQILSNVHLEIDTSHFFWLVTYFLKFATQIELDLEHVCSVLSMDIISYLTAEGVNLCEQFELSIKLDGNDLKPRIRRLHLVVTAIREFIQAIEVYKKSVHIRNEDKQTLLKLQVKMCETDELRSLLLLLLRHYNPNYQSRQYLQDLLVTNHILLIFLDTAMKWPEYKGKSTMLEHIRQFASPEIMCQYGLLLENYEGNGEFVNDCIFTMMHHVGGEVGSLMSLFQPSILQTFTTIWKSDFEICDDWTDLVEYVINTFVKKPSRVRSKAQQHLKQLFDDDKLFKEILCTPAETEAPLETNNSTISVCAESVKRWTEDEISSLSWNYMQCNNSADMIGEIIKLFKENGIYKTRDSVIKELYNQFIINKDEFDKLLQSESDSTKDKDSKSRYEGMESREDEIGKLCEQLRQDGKFKFMDWVQDILLETCAAKIFLEKHNKEKLANPSTSEGCEKSFEKFRKFDESLPVISPVSYHSLLLNQSVPLVPWNCHQASICKDLKFLQLLNKLGFHMPVDSGKVFIRIPHFWTRDFLYEVAAKISPIDASKLKFSLSEISRSSILESRQTVNIILPELSMTAGLSPIPDNIYQIHGKKQNLASMVNFTPMPGSSYTSSLGDIAKPSWLEVVQKSQKYKITLDLETTLIDEVDMIAKTCKPELSIPRNMPDLPVLLVPTMVTVKQEINKYDISMDESEYCSNSLCETASVASDLTRMYVSDEDDKPLLMPPLRPLSPMHDDCASDAASDAPSDATSDGVIAEKRPRRHLLPPF